MYVLADECDTPNLQENCCASCREVLMTTTAPKCPGDSLPNCAELQELLSSDICDEGNDLRYIII